MFYVKKTHKDMSAIRNLFNKMRPSFEEGGKLHAFRSVFDGFETFALVPNDTSKTGVNIHDAIDSKRIMSIVVIALVPAMLFGMYNIGYQNYLAAGTLAGASFFEIFAYGFLAVLPKVLVSYIVGLGIEFAWAQWKGEEIQEGYLGNTLPDGFTAATPLGQMAQGINPDASICNMICGFIPGSIGETSLIAIGIGAVILLWTGIASWRTMLSVFVGGAVLACIFEHTGQPMVWWHHFILGGFAFGAVFMATDPVTSSRTTTGQFIYGFLIGAMTVIIRVMNAGYPEGMMLAIFFGNMCAPMIDHFIVERNISKRLKRGGTK